MTRLSGWGRHHAVDCDFVEPETTESLARHVDPTGTISRGLGRSYGDQAVNEHRRVIGTARLNRFLSFDEKTGVLRCEAGVTLAEIIRSFAPRGWFPLITPGTKLVTVGGCIANDVHGKAHHAQGAFNTCVKSMRMLTASGEVLTLSRDENAELFWANFGGLGLLGIILDATIQLRAITTTYFRQRSRAYDTFEALLDAIDAADHEAPYSVATIDAGATGRHLGRGVLTVGDHATPDDLPARLANDPLKVNGPSPLLLPVEMPAFALNTVTAAVLNQVFKQVLVQGRPIAHADSFFYPLDAIGDWNLAYGRRGFIQYQFVLPLGAGREKLRALLEAIVLSGKQPFLNVLKRMGPEGQGHLSFPLEGYTLAIDFPIRGGTEELTHRLDAMVVEAGGRVYLGKDSFLQPHSLEAMYSRLAEWKEVKRRIDPKSVFQSDLGRRVGLVG